MKKLMIAAAVVCAAAFANAATAVWGVGYINDVNGDPLGASSAGYSATLSIYSDAALSSLVTSSTISDWDGGLAFGETEDALTNSPETTYYGQIIMSYNDKTISSEGFQFTTSSLSDQSEIYIMSAADEISGIEKIGGGDFDGANGAFSAATGVEWQTIPEPTSGLLLLLGIAGLSLRRKRA